MTELAQHPLFTVDPIGKQGEFHSSLADSRFCIAGNQSGKTTCGAREAAWYSSGLHPVRENIPVPNIGWIVTLDRTFVEEVLLPAVLEWLPEQLIKKISRGDTIQILLHNGSKIVFHTYGQGWRKFQGAKIHWAWFDEECPADVYDEVQVRLLRHKGPHWVTMTPLMGKTWVYTRIVAKQYEFSPGELELFSWSTLDNTWLDPERVQKIFGRMPENIRAARMRGDFIDLTGLVFPQFDEKVHVVNAFKLPSHWPVFVGMDYGYRHPFAASFMARDERGRIVVWKVYKQPEKLLAQHARSILEILLEHAPHTLDQSAVRRVLDAIKARRIPDERPFVRARFVIDSTAQQARREFVPYGLSVDNCEKRMVLPRIERLGSLLLDTVEGRPGIVMMRGRCGHLIDELRTYSWKPKRAGADENKPAPPEPQDVFDDAIDGTGYGVLSAPTSAIPLSRRPPEDSIAWLRKIRERVGRVTRRRMVGRETREAMYARMAGRRVAGLS